MKKNNTANYRKFAITAVLLVSLTFAFCAGNKGDKNETQTTTQAENTSPQDLETDMDKYAGLYVLKNFDFYSVGKFPENSVVHFDSAGGKHFPLNKKFIGKYFMTHDKFSFETSKVTQFAGGYITPREGSVLVGIEKNGGVIHQQSYLNSKSNHGDLELGGEGVYGKFILREDGKYNLSVNNAIYVWTKRE